MATIQTIIEQLHLLFDIFNDHYFHGELIKPVILTQSNAQHRLALGWCSTRKIWKDTLSGEFYYEITLSSEFLFLGVHRICETLLHEMVHLRNLQKGIQDCSRNNTYHNKRFKETAERSGLIVSHIKEYGWTHTVLSPAAVAFIDSLGLDPHDFSLTRDTLYSPEAQEPRPKTFKYVCPHCGQYVRSAKTLSLICGQCEEKMEVSD